MLPNILRNKSNQTTKFGQLIEDNIRNIVFEKSYTKSGWRKPYSKKSKLTIPLDQ